MPDQGPQCFSSQPEFRRNQVGVLQIFIARRGQGNGRVDRADRLENRIAMLGHQRNCRITSISRTMAQGFFD